MIIAGTLCNACSCKTLIGMHDQSRGHWLWLVVILAMLPTYRHIRIHVLAKNRAPL